MSDYESLGSDTRNNRQIVYLVIVILSTLLVGSIFAEEFGLLTSVQQNLFLNSLFLPILSISMFVGIIGFMILTERFKDKILIGLIIITLAASIWFIRESITFFSTSEFSSALALGTIYTLLGVFSTAFLTLNMIRPKGEDGIDTVTSEESSEGVFGLDFKWKMAIAGALVIGIYFYITTTGLAFVQAPNFGLVEFGILDTQFGNAFVSAVVGGVIETAVFFAILMPVVHGLTFRFTNNAALASAAGIIVVSLIFWQFHTTVYSYSEAAQLSVAIFGIGNAILLFLFRDAFMLKFVHFFNNLFVILFAVTTFSVILL